MNRLLHTDIMTAEALRLYASAKNLQLEPELALASNPLHHKYLSNPMIGAASLPIMLLHNGTCIATTRSIIDYLEATRRIPKILSADPSPNPAQIAAIHLVISAIQRTLYLIPDKATTTQWAETFVDFYDGIRSGQSFLEAGGFSVLDCFFYPAAGIYLTALRPTDRDAEILHNYRDRVLSKTVFSHDPAYNLELMEFDDEQ